MAYDIRTESGVAVFGASADSLAVTFGTAVTDTTKAFLRLTQTTYSSAGPDTAVVANLNNDDVSARIVQSSVTTTGFSIERETGGLNADVRVHWELWEYTGPADGPNEFEVLKRDDVRATAGVASGSRGAETLPITNSDWDKVTVHSTGTENNGTGNTYADALVALSLDKTDTAEAVDWQRGTSAAQTWFSYCLVWWKGSNYSVQNTISHSFTAAGTNETETITAVTWAETAIFATHRTGVSGLDEVGYNVWEGATTTSMRFRLRSGAGTSGQTVEVMLVSNPTWSVERDDSITGTETEAPSGNTDVTTTITSVDLTRAAAIATADCNGTGTAYPRPHWGYRLSAATTFAMRRGRNGQASDWTWQVISLDGKTVTGSGGDTLEATSATGSGTYTGPVYTGSGSATLEPTSADGAGTFTAPVYTGSGGGTLEPSSATGSGTFTPPVFTGSGGATLEAATATGSGAFTAPVYTGPGSATLSATTATGAGTFSAGSPHVFDLATHAPGDLAIMLDLGWYGIPSTDPVPGPDPATGAGGNVGYGNWWLAGTSYNALDPVAYPELPYTHVDPSACSRYHGDMARRIASYFRPATGLYSSSGQDASSLAKADLDLGLLRRAGDPRGRCTGWACEVAHLPATELGGNTPGGANWLLTSDIRVKNLQTKLARAVADATLGSCVTILYNAQFVANYGYADTAAELTAIGDDLEVYVNLLAASSAGLRVKSGAYDPTGRLLIMLWIGSENDYTAAEWGSMLDDVRSATGEDFYVASRYSGFDTGGVFDFADACWPWSANSDWASATGATMRLKAEDWTRLRHDQIITQAASFTGRVVMGSLFPGFEDWAKGFGQSLDRDIPRDEDLVLGQTDRFATDGITALQVGTWNDYPEGTIWEPRLVTSGSSTDKDATDPPSNITAEGDELRWLTEAIADLYSETVTPSVTESLVALWTDYGDPRACAAFGTREAAYGRAGAITAEGHASTAQARAPIQGRASKGVAGAAAATSPTSSATATSVAGHYVAP